jgi:hypothetical protein
MDIIERAARAIYDESDLLERLRRLEPVYNGCAVPCGQEPVNPDGPEAADLIERLINEIAELRKRG